MKREGIHIRQWLFAISFLLLAVACSSSDDEQTEEPQAATLTVYVYAPERPMLIRGSVGKVDATEAERTVYQLQIWVFEHSTGNLVGYLSTDKTELLNTSGDQYRIVVSDDFARHKPQVDVYVLANVTESNCGISFNRYTSRDQLSSAKLDSNHFGVGSLTTEVPADGLPMAGVLINQDIVGDAPVLRIGSTNSIATVQLERTISKVRFVFGTTGPTHPTITGISLDANTLYTEGYLMKQSLTGLTLWNTSLPLLTTEFEVISETTDPTQYLYDGQEAQVYENLINTAVEDGKLMVVGPYYLHESDKQLTGTITYRIGEEVTPYEMAFQMDAASDFLRNHSWIVYAYYTGTGLLQMNALYIKEWTTKEENHEVYNW